MKDKDVFIFGDSIVCGVGDNEKCGWVNRFRLDLENSNIGDYNVFNLGISGDVTQGVRNRFEFEVNTRKNEENETIIIFAIGENDTQDIGGEGRVLINVFEQNIVALIKMAREYCNNIMFVGFLKVDEAKVVPLPWDHKKSYFNHKIIEFDNCLEKICKENNVNYLKVYDLLLTEELIDGLHPDCIGHQKLCDKVTDFFMEHFKI